MNDKHITYLKVENFKCFETFELNKIGQFNLITGDNNIGKTSVLEALLFDEDEEIFAQNLYTSLIYRFQFAPTQTDFLDYFQRKDTEEPISITFNQGKKITLKANKDLNSASETAPISLRISGNKNILYIKPTKETRDIPIIYYGNVYENNVTGLYSKYIQDKRSQKQKLISALNVISPTIEFLEVSNSATDYPTLVVTQSHLDAGVPLALMGSGVIKLARILIEIVGNSENRLMIDDIASDVHPSRLADFWRVILWFCHENEVQLFATSQNPDCIRVFQEVLAEEESGELQKNAQVFDLQADENGKISAKSLDFEPSKKEILNNNHSVEVQQETL